jgi:hypothetical protein
VAQLTLLPEYEEPYPFIGRIYFMTDGVRIKIGYTERPPKRRGGELKTEVIYVIPGDELAERREHNRWSANRIGMTEWFEARYRIMVWLALQVNPADDPRAAGALEWLAGNLDQRERLAAA